MLRARTILRSFGLSSLRVVSGLTVLTCLLPVRSALGQLTPRAEVPLQSPADAIIGPGDLLEMRVFDVDELSGSYRVSGQGTLDLPLIGKVSAVGISPSRLAFEIADRYRQGGFILNPQITIRTLEFATQGITVTGEVLHPGIYPIFGPRAVSDALALAGGLTVTADSHIQVRHRSAPSVQTIQLPFEGTHTAEAENAQVVPGDTIFVPRAGVIYVLGEVNRPGGISMRNSGHLTVLEALSEAQGAKHTASEQHAFILRKTGETYDRVPLPINTYLKGHNGDVELQAGDVFVVPGSATKIFFQDSSILIASLAGAVIYTAIQKF